MFSAIVTIKQDNVLADECHAAAQAFERYSLMLMPPIKISPSLGLREARQHIGQGGFAATRCADQGSHSALWDKTGDVVSSCCVRDSGVQHRNIRYRHGVWAEDLFAFVCFSSG